MGAGISSAARHPPAPPAARGWGFARIQLPSAGKKSISHLCWYELFSAPPTPVFAAQVCHAWAAKKKNTTFYLLAVIVLCECVQLKGNVHLLVQPSDRPICSHVEAGDPSNATWAAVARRKRWCQLVVPCSCSLGSRGATHARLEFLHKKQWPVGEIRPLGLGNWTLRQPECRATLSARQRCIFLFV